MLSSGTCAFNGQPGNCLFRRFSSRVSCLDYAGHGQHIPRGDGASPSQQLGWILWIRLGLGFSWASLLNNVQEIENSINFLYSNGIHLSCPLKLDIPRKRDQAHVGCHPQCSCYGSCPYTRPYLPHDMCYSPHHNFWWHDMWY